MNERRKAELFVLLGRGKTPEQIAKWMGMSVAGVKRVIDGEPEMHPAALKTIEFQGKEITMREAAIWFIDRHLTTAATPNKIANTIKMLTRRLKTSDVVDAMFTPPGFSVLQDKPIKATKRKPLSRRTIRRKLAEKPGEIFPRSDQYAAWERIKHLVI